MREIGEEVKGNKLARVWSVEEMLPKVAENQISRGNQARIGEEQYAIIEQAFQMDATIEEACILAGISVQSYHNHREKNPDFARRVDIAKQFPRMIARAAVQKRIRQGDAKTALRFLELRDRKRYTANPVYEDDETQETKAPVVQFISVARNEGADQTENDSQTSTKQNSVSEGSLSSGEKLTPRENEDITLKRLSS